MLCSFKSPPNLRHIFHRKLKQTLSQIQSPKLQALKQNLTQDAEDFLDALNSDFALCPAMKFGKSSAYFCVIEPEICILSVMFLTVGRLTRACIQAEAIVPC